MKNHQFTRLLSLLLVVAMLAGLTVPVSAAGSNGSVTFRQVDNDTVSVDLLTQVPDQEIHTPEHLASDVVRVSIILDGRSTLEAGFSTQNIADNAEAVSYRAGLLAQQKAVTAAIEAKTGEQLDVAWNLTLAANIISANVKYGQIAAIEAVPGVKSVVLEAIFEPDVVAKDETAKPNMATSSAQIGSGAAWAAGYTGAGSRIAIIDTGADVNHQSFDPAAFEYSLAERARSIGMSTEDYMAGLELLDAQEIAAVAEQLNVAIDAGQTYVNSKVAYGYNYVDKDYDIIHMNDSKGEHGSHVAGIAAANAFVSDGNGSFVPALESVFTQGVAPDAQLLIMKVFGKNGGALESDYMAAIEDAIILGADSVNLSLGGGYPGSSKCPTPEYQAIMEQISNSGTVVSMSAGNSGTWVEQAYNGGHLYADDVSLQTDGSPGSYTNAMAVASVDNDGVTGAYVGVGGKAFIYSETQYSNEPFATLAGEQEYVYIDGYGSDTDWAAVGEALVGKIALCIRGGGISFYVKAEEAVKAGAIGTFICNNTDGVLNMNLADYSMTAPVAALTMADAAAIKAASTPVTGENGEILYYTGTMSVSAGMSTVQMNSPYYTMSKFSSWGVPGSLELKPELAAPGGSIYSVYGEIPGGGGYDQYVYMSGTSMAAPQIAGMAALVAQYIRERGLEEQTGLSARHLSQSLLMSTAVPMLDGNSGVYYPVLQQGAGLANVGAAVGADSYILMDENANAGAADGKVKAELGDDPERTGVYEFSFDLNNLTDAQKAFELSAAFFTQDVFEDYANSNKSEAEMAAYLDLLAAWLAADVTWTADGVVLEPSGDLAGLDFDGNGSVNAADGQALLDYVVNPAVGLSNHDSADLDLDGDVDSYDVYLFFTKLHYGTVLVAPYGSVTVNVVIALTEDQKAELDVAYPCGAYVQGYVFAESLADAEGLEGTSHSIPLLGFYGSWTDASMYDVGTYQEYATGQEIRTPYLDSKESNAYVISYADQPNKTYYFGGNPIVPDDVYMPERNAINGTNGDRISSVHFAAIRNAAASRFTAVNKTTGEVYGESELGEVASAFYYDSVGYWMNTMYSMNTNVKPLDIPEGEIIELSLALAPEYYVDDAGNVAWDALGEGAYLSVPMVVDNTAPVLKSVALDFMSNSLIVKASDNEYVAAVGLYNKSGSQCYGLAGAKQDIEKNTDAEFVLDLKNVSGKRFLVQVFDYARNVSTYLVEMEMGGQVELPEMIAYDRTRGYWTHFTRDTRYDYSVGMPVYEPTELNFYAATIADHMVLASTDKGDLYVMPETDLSDMVYVNNMGAVVTDMAYNKADGNVYGVADGKLVIIDKRSGLLTEVGQIGIETTTLACDENGNFYCHLVNGSTVYTFTKDTVAEPTVLVQEIYCDELYQALRCSDIQAMEINPNTGMLCWSSLFVWSAMWSYSYYVEIDPADGSYKIYNDLSDKFAALIIPEKSAEGGDDWTAPTDKVDGVSMSFTELTMLRNTEKSLVATVYPWSATDRSVTWTTSDPSVATVDSHGLVSARSAGTAVITATSNLDPSVSASCTVTVEILDMTLNGMLQDENGVAEFFTWNMATEDTWTAGKEIDTDMTAGALNPTDGTYYIMDSTRDVWAMHKVNADGETVENSGANAIKVPLWDMTYSTYFSDENGQDMIAGIYDYYVFLPNDPMKLEMRVFDMYWYLDELVGITTLGHESRYDDWYGVQRETEHFKLLDTDGYVYDLWVYANDDGSMGSMIDYRLSDLNLAFEGYENLYKYTSLMAGEDGALYLSAFNGSTNEIYRMTYNEDEGIYNAVRLADVGEEVWPAVLTEVKCNGTSNQKAKPVESFPETAKRMDASVMSLAELSSTVVAEEDGQTITVDITAEVAATNGLTTVSYDASKLSLDRVTIHGDYSSRTEDEGEVTFGYVSMTEIPAGEAVATLTFSVLEAVASEITVEHQQVNNQAGATETLKVSFEKTAVNPFTDVSEDSFYYESVLWAVEEGITTGTSETTFSPNEVCGRAQAVTFLWRAAGSPEPSSLDNPFVDVTEKDFYFKAVLWAVEESITYGVDATHFAPMKNCSRAEIVTFLWRAEGKPAASEELPFTDVQAGAFYAEAVRWAAEKGIANGLTATTFGPDAVCNRAQIVTFLYRTLAA